MTWHFDSSDQIWDSIQQKSTLIKQTFCGPAWLKSQPRIELASCPRLVTRFLCNSEKIAENDGFESLTFGKMQTTYAYVHCRKNDQIELDFDAGFPSLEQRRKFQTFKFVPKETASNNFAPREVFQEIQISSVDYIIKFPRNFSQRWASFKMQMKTSLPAVLFIGQSDLFLSGFQMPF